MNVVLLTVGKTGDGYVREGVAAYEKRLKRFLPFEICTTPEVKHGKGRSVEQHKAREGELLLKRLSPGDEVVLLDERGAQMRSVEFARFLEAKMVASVKRLVFVLGGPYGFSAAVYARANAELALSRLTFSHQLARLIFVEQLYRANTILRGEPYHHE